MNVAGLVLVIIGILLVNLEGLGKKRVEAMEKGLLRVARVTGGTLGTVILYYVVPSRFVGRPDHKVPPALATWWYSRSVRWAIVGISILSVIFVFPRLGSTFVLPNEALHVPVWAIGLASYATYLLAGLLLYLTMHLVDSLWHGSILGKVLTISLLPSACAQLLLFVLGFMGVLVFSFPVILILGLYIVLTVLTHLLHSFIEWKDSVKAGSFFKILGAVVSVAGALLLFLS